MPSHSRNFSADGANYSGALVNLNKKMDDWLHSRPDAKPISVSFTFTPGRVETGQVGSIEAHALLVFESPQKG